MKNLPNSIYRNDEFIYGYNDKSKLIYIQYENSKLIVTGHEDYSNIELSSWLITKDTELVCISKFKGIHGIINRKHFISIVKAKDCLFSRREGHKGIVIFGYSIRLKIFGINLI